MKVEQHRDLTLIHVDDEKIIVIACDSCGEIGLKEMDALKASNDVVGYFTASVVLGELLSYRATPLAMVNNFCVEMEPTGKEIIQGIKKALKEVGLDSKVHLTGSTEENMPTVVTAIGLTAVGIINRNSWISPETFSEDNLYLIGTPRVGEEVLGFDKVPVLKVISEINQLPSIHEILPVGSKGIDYEIGELCKTNKLAFAYTDGVKTSVHKSAGPATCALVSGQKEAIESTLQNLGAQYTCLGKFAPGE